MELISKKNIVILLLFHIFCWSNNNEDNLSAELNRKYQTAQKAIKERDFQTAKKTLIEHQAEAPRDQCAEEQVDLNNSLGVCPGRRCLAAQANHGDQAGYGDDNDFDSPVHH